MIQGKTFGRVATAVMTVLVIISLLPILLIVIASFSSETSLIQNGYSYFPKSWSLDSYYYMIKQGVMISRSYLVSISVTFLGTALSVILTTMLAYPMSRKSFRYRNVLAFFVFFTMLFNGGIVPSPLYTASPLRVRFQFVGPVNTHPVDNFATIFGNHMEQVVDHLCLRTMGFYF